MDQPKSPVLMPRTGSARPEQLIRTIPEMRLLISSAQTCAIAPPTSCPIRTARSSLWTNRSTRCRTICECSRSDNPLSREENECPNPGKSTEKHLNLGKSRSMIGHQISPSPNLPCKKKRTGYSAPPFERSVTATRQSPKLNLWCLIREAWGATGKDAKDIPFCTAKKRPRRSANG
jgi:hypothetical protein